ncbi:hypothetical protein TBR22_A12740 [Luteitalea sp. TBR-22]|uniref:hypothetical protein n=1 Tax=Luteitalea sp. TBR-22 TaxID=2802971 RepID=UPI001AFC541B|nr:hypothetical protein [Luteitalea sp. TBR-22]BCS32069.1 hypothetical protein TBR22_A12740 [Luteitalea sp. TBR-22]
MSRTLIRAFASSIVTIALLSPGASIGAAAQETGSALGLARPGIAARIERPATEVVESAGKSIPDPLTAQRTESFLNETITTTRAGRLLITKSMELTTTCTPTSGVIYFLVVDGVPLRNSATFSRTGVTGQITGVTTDIVAAGAHTITVGLTCTVPGAFPSGATVTLIGITSAIVLP